MSGGLVILGNSHLAALRAAWDAMQSHHPGADVRFFGGIAPVFAAMTLDDSGCFGLTDPGLVAPEDLKKTRRMFGGTAIDLTDAGTVAIAGVDWQVWALFDLLDTFAIDPLGSGGPDEPRLSAAAFHAVLAALAEAALAPLDWARRIAAPVILMPRPIPPETLAEDGHATGARILRISGRGLGPALAMLEAALIEGAAARGLTWLPQPAGSRAPSGLTAAAMNRGGLRLRRATEGTEAQDYEHMNAEFGAMVLTALLSARPAPGHPA